MNDFYQTFLHAYGRKLPAPMINPHIHKQKSTREKIGSVIGQDGVHTGRRCAPSWAKMAHIPGGGCFDPNK